jgi:hypothetical protein
VPAEQRLASTTVDSNGRLTTHSAQTICAESVQPPEGAPDSEQCMSGAQRSQSSNGRNRQNPNGWVTWLAHQTLSGAPIDSSLSPTVELVVGAINTPNHLHSNHQSIHSFTLNTRAIYTTPKTQFKRSIRSKSQNQL